MGVLERLIEPGEYEFEGLVLAPGEVCGLAMLVMLVTLGVDTSGVAETLVAVLVIAQAHGFLLLFRFGGDCPLPLPAPMLLHPGLDSTVGVPVGVGVLLLAKSSIINDVVDPEIGSAVGVNTAVSYEDDDEDDALGDENGLLLPYPAKSAIECVLVKAWNGFLLALLFPVGVTPVLRALFAPDV
jgi:hypothetical protein